MSRQRRSELVRTLERALHRLADGDRRMRQATADQLGVSAADLDALLVLDEAGALAAGRIAEALAITTGAVTGLVDRLERTGWVQRTRNEADRRQVVVELAGARRDDLLRHRTAREQLLAEALAELDVAALAAGTELVAAIADKLADAGRDRAGAAGPADDDPASADRAPIGDLERATLRFTTGAARLELRGARMRDLYRASFQGKRPSIAVADGVVTVQAKGLGWWGRSARAELALTSSVAWKIEISKGVSQVSADLRELEVSGIDITGGANETEVRLPRPVGGATMRVKGGANRVTVRRPRGVEVQAIIRGGASHLVLDDQTIGSLGGPARLASPGWERATDRWSIELTGGASNVEVTTEP